MKKFLIRVDKSLYNLPLPIRMMIGCPILVIVCIRNASPEFWAECRLTWHDGMEVIQDED